MTDLTSTTLYIYGAGGFGKELLYLIRNAHRPISVSGFVDDNSRVSQLQELPVLSHVPENAWLLPSIANPHIRKRIVEQFEERIWNQPIIHHTIHLDSHVKVGKASILCEGVRCTTDIRIGKSVIINLNATIGHDCVIEDYVSIMPGANISGNVFIGEGTLIGSGAVILPGIKIGAWSKVGAGAVVTKDVPDNTTVIGVPARRVEIQN